MSFWEGIKNVFSGNSVPNTYEKEYTVKYAWRFCTVFIEYVDKTTREISNAVLHYYQYDSGDLYSLVDTNGVVDMHGFTTIEFYEIDDVVTILELDDCLDMTNEEISAIHEGLEQPTSLRIQSSLIKSIDILEKRETKYGSKYTKTVQSRLV